MSRTSLAAILFVLPLFLGLPVSVAGILNSQRGDKIYRPVYPRLSSLLFSGVQTAADRSDDDSKNDSSCIVSPYEELDKFLAACSDCNSKRPGSINIVQQGSNKLPPCEEVHSHVYSSEDGCIIAVVGSGLSIDKVKLETVLSTTVNSPELDRVQSLCGFPAGSIPPIGHSSSSPISILVDENLLIRSQMEETMLLFGGGYAYWKSLVSSDFLLSQPNVHVADISDPNKRASSSLRPSSSLFSAFSASAETNPLPLEALEAPSMYIARIVSQQRELSNPLTPVTVAVTGRVGKIQSQRKQMVVCELLPIHIVTDADNKDQPAIGPWNSKDGVDMSVSLIFGKLLLQRLGKLQGEAAIESLKEGIEIQLQAKTNVGSRESLGKWVDARTLDLLVFDFQILRGDSDGPAVSSATRYKHVHPSNRVATSPGMPGLTMNDIFSEGSVHLVDDMASLRNFTTDIETLLSELAGNHNCGESRCIDLSSNLVGIDCEWQPQQLMESRQPQPILLMQVSLQRLAKVYLFDFQTMLRPLMSQDTPMNPLENEICKTFDKLLASTVIFKAGYQLSTDLQRIAASYPHMPCFHEVHGVVEVSALIKRILHVTKQKKSRMITMSLTRMTEHYIGRTVNKEFQVSDWSSRPLKQDQLNYAALDAAVAPKLVEKALESIDARIDMAIPLFVRWDGDTALSKIIESWRFTVLATEDQSEIQKLKAKQIVGPSWIVPKSWITRRMQSDSNDIAL